MFEEQIEKRQPWAAVFSSLTRDGRGSIFRLMNNVARDGAPVIDDPSLTNATASLAQALAHPVRLQILDLLRGGGAYVMHLTTSLDRRQANISQHLAVLREAGLVVDEREGMTVSYRVRDPRVFDLVDELMALARPEGARQDNSPNFSTAALRLARGPLRQRACRCPRCCGR